MAYSIIAFAQSPQRMTYQCVVRNAGGVLVANKSVGIRISIMQGTPEGNVVFQETYNPTPETNANGLVSIEIGSGLNSVGSFPSINWESGPFFLMTETDPDGGSNYTIAGTSQLLSVPYAIYANKAGNVFSGDYSDLLNRPALLREETDEFNASSGQTSFTLTRTPSTNSKVKMFINGVRISNTAYSITNNVLTYMPVYNGSYALTSGDRIQFDYSY